MKLSVRAKCDGCPFCDGDFCSEARRELDKKNLYHELPDWCPLPVADNSDLADEVAGLKKSVTSLKGSLTKARAAIKSLGV